VVVGYEARSGMLGWNSSSGDFLKHKIKLGGGGGGLVRT